MSRRLDTNGNSDVRRQIRLTPEEAEEADALAAYLKTTFSDLVRHSLREKRRSLVAAGQKPPRRLRDQG
jgi:hypothetical protein